MKPNVLMINDWVYSDTLNAPFQIGRPSDFRFMYTKAYDVFDEDGHFIHIHPIPLTEDILLANDFKKKNGYKYKELTLTDNMELFVYKKHIKIKYVHQLQHILRDCEYTDLADNLKLSQP